jgi:hypothetical protein
MVKNGTCVSLVFYASLPAAAARMMLHLQVQSVLSFSTRGIPMGLCSEEPGFSLVAKVVTTWELSVCVDLSTL